MADEHMRPVGAALRVAAALAALRLLSRGTGALAGLAMSLVLGLLALPGVAAGAAGDLDPSFGAGRGFVTTLFSVSKSVTARAVVIQPSGRIVAGGGEAANVNLGPLLLAGYRPDGSLDPGFGDGGKVETSLGPNLQATIVGLGQQPDGKLVAGATTSDPSTGDGEFVAARYTADGVLDPTFGMGGIARTSFPPVNGCEALGFALAPDGTLVVAGTAFTDVVTPVFALARFRSDGSLDTSFGDGGRVVTVFPDSPDSEVLNVVVQPDGRIVASGFIFGGTRIAIVRYMPDGTLDPSFAGDGMVIEPEELGGAPWGLARDAAGRLVVAGSRSRAPFGDMVLLRYLSDGSRDPSFGTGGLVLTGAGINMPLTRSVAIAADGTLVLAGSADLATGGNQPFVARFLGNGALDPTFGSAGATAVPLGVDNSEARAVALQPDGRIVTAGGATAPGEAFAVVRLQGLNPPVNNVAPRIEGTPAPGARLTCQTRAPDWTNGPTAFAFQWLRDGAPIAGATHSDYVVARGDAEHSIACQVTASNSGGSGQATSAPVRIAGPPATVIPGGGPEKSDCYVVLAVEGTRALRTKRILECPDGDPSCDLDGLCNDQCRFGLRVCINQPGLAGCTPPRALDRLRLRYRPPTVTLRPPAVLQGPVCSETVEAGVAVIQRPNVACSSAACSGRKRPGRARVTAIARAVRGTQPRFARDSYVLRCLPRVGPCPPQDAAVNQELDAAVNQALKDFGAPGAIVGISVPGKIDYAKAFGVGDKATNTPLRLDDHVRIASVTKSFTGTAILQLVDQKKVQLSDPISKYVDGVPSGDKISLKMLGEMRSGLYSYTTVPNYEAFAKLPFLVESRKGPTGGTVTAQQLLDFAFQHPLNFEPGTQFEYSNTNTILLGQVVEKISGQPLAEYFKQHIFEPLRLGNSLYPANGNMPGPYGHGYSNLTDDGTIQDATLWNPSWGNAAGAIVSGFPDMKIWARTLGKDNTLLTPETQKWRLESLQPESLQNVPQESSYGFAIAENHGWIGHDGQIPGYLSMVRYLPEEDATLVILTNTDVRKDNMLFSSYLAKIVTTIATPEHIFSLPPAPAPDLEVSPSPTTSAGR